MRTLLCSTLFTLTGPLFAQDRSPLPLRVGNRWDYTVTTTNGVTKPTTATSTAYDEAACTLPDGTELHQLRVTTADGVTMFEHWSSGTEGVCRHPTADRRRRGALGSGPAMRMLPAASQPPAEWEWQGPHDLVADEQGRDFTHRGTNLGAARITVGAGTFATTHVRIESLRDGVVQVRRELWFAPGIGIVRDLHRDAIRTVERTLTCFTAPAVDDEQRLRTAVDEQLHSDRFQPWNNRPHAAWLEAGPEALQLPGRIALVRTDTSAQAWFVGEKDVRWFKPGSADQLAGAVRAAFGGDSALLPDDVPLAPLALLLARTEAARQHLGKVTPTELSLTPRGPLPGDSHRQAAVQVRGGALDGTTANIAVWITVRGFTQVQLATDLTAPDERSATR